MFSGNELWWEGLTWIIKYYLRTIKVKSQVQSQFTTIDRQPLACYFCYNKEPPALKKINPI